MSLPQVDLVYAAVAELAEHLQPVSRELLPLTQTGLRVLAEPILADRDSPPLNVSAMDGYAISLNDLPTTETDVELPVKGVAAAGSPPPRLEPGSATRIFTGAPVPDGADCVVPREQTRESQDRVELLQPSSERKAGQNIRYRGENARAGTPILPAGICIDGAAMAAVASVAGPQLSVYRRVRVAIINTGDELIEPGETAADWQIRDSNGPTLETMLRKVAWVEIVVRRRAGDRLEAITDALERVLPSADAVLLTGGVSMGDTDFVPAAIQQVGGRIHFHRLPIRPGKPVLGAATAQGKLILGLPGNPVSVAVTANAIGMPLLKRLAGIAPIVKAGPMVSITDSDSKQLPLIWHRLVEFSDAGDVRYVETRGSGDLISLARSQGFVTLPAGASGPGPWPLTLWP